jgi:hypothetical protein
MNEVIRNEAPRTQENNVPPVAPPLEFVELPGYRMPTDSGVIPTRLGLLC